MSERLGSMLEPIFKKSAFQNSGRDPCDLQPSFRGKRSRSLSIFCSTCGTKVFLAASVSGDFLASKAETFDDPNWFERNLEISKHIFLGVAQNGTFIPAGVGTFREHAMLEDGTLLDHVIFARPYTTGTEEEHL